MAHTKMSLWKLVEDTREGGGAPPPGSNNLRRFSTRQNFSTKSKFSFVLQALRWNLSEIF